MVSLFALVLNPIALLLWLVVVCLLVWAARAIMKAFELPQPIQTLIYVAIIVVVVLYLVQLAGGMPSLRIG